MSEDIYAPLEPFNRQVMVLVSLCVQFPGMAQPFYLEGLQILVDRYFYERYSEVGELDQYLHHEAVRVLLKHSKIRRVAIGHYGDKPFPLGDSCA